jgi:glucuronokinase
VELIRTHAYARAGLLGNPSDGYFGKTIALPVRNFRASVVLYEWPELEIMLSPQDRCSFNRLDDLCNDVRSHGYFGGLPLVKATLRKFWEYCRKHAIALHERNFSLRYESNIPRQVGMAGSSAIIAATLRALMRFYNVEIPLEIQPNLVLNVEREELGIAGGLQDRVCQCYETLVFMNFDRSLIEGRGYGEYIPLDLALLPPLFMAYDVTLSEPSGIVHSNIRQRWEAGEPKVRQAMLDLASYAEQGRAAILAGDHARLNELIDMNFEVRRGILDLDPRHVAMIELARSLGASAHYAGSGGSIVGAYRDPETFQKLKDEFAKMGCRVIRPA